MTTLAGPEAFQVEALGTGKIEAELQRAGREGDHPVLVELLEQVQNLKSIVDSLLMFSRSDHCDR